jgi:hypothetical protein
MTDDQKALAAELDQLAADHFRLANDAASLANRVRRLGRVGDALADLRSGAFLTVRQAAIICLVSDQTIYDWIKDAERLGRPIAEKRATWMVGRDELFAYVEKWRGGPSARDAAAARLQEYWPKWQAQEMPAHVKRATG